MDIAAATIISVSGTIGEKNEFSNQSNLPMLIFQETSWNVSVPTNPIKTNLAIAAVTMDSASGMIGRRVEEVFLLLQRIKLTNFTLDRLIAMLTKSIRMSMGIVTAGITQEVKLHVDTGNFVNQVIKIASSEQSKAQECSNLNQDVINLESTTLMPRDIAHVEPQKTTLEMNVGMSTTKSTT